MILSFDRKVTSEEVREFMKNYWVPQEWEFNTDTQVYEVFMRPFNRMEDL